MPYIEQDNLYASIRPTLVGSPDDPAVMSGLRQLSRNGEFSLSSLFAAASVRPMLRRLVSPPATCRWTIRRFGTGFSACSIASKALLQIGVNNEGEHTGGINLEDILRPGSRGAVPIFNFGDLKALTREYCPSDSSRLHFERELIRLARSRRPSRRAWK